MMDASAGLVYTFFVTLVILYALKILQLASGIGDGGDEDLILDKLEACPQYTWRD
jgi:hypothetical protein